MMPGFSMGWARFCIFCEALVNIWRFQVALAVKNRYSLRCRLSLTVKTFTQS